MGKQLVKRKPAAKAIALKKQTDVFSMIGLDKFLKPDEVNSLKLLDIIRKGLPMRIINNFGKLFLISKKELAHILNLSERTLQRYTPDKLLDKHSTAHTIQLAELYEEGVQLFGNIDKFNMWMNYPSFVFGDKKPIELIDTPIGIKLVHQHLVRIAHGVYL